MFQKFWTSVYILFGEVLPLFSGLYRSLFFLLPVQSGVRLCRNPRRAYPRVSLGWDSDNCDFHFLRQFFLDHSIDFLYCMMRFPLNTFLPLLCYIIGWLERDRDGFLWWFDVYLCRIVLSSSCSNRFACLILDIFCFAPSLTACFVSFLASCFSDFLIDQRHRVLLLFNFAVAGTIDVFVALSVVWLILVSLYWICCLLLFEFVYLRLPVWNILILWSGSMPSNLFLNPRTTVLQLKTWHLSFFLFVLSLAWSLLNCFIQCW